ncbi:MAG: Rne/Rng family ribonuclease [Calditrichaeota bacterium]|nr:MAG: Rne/Rng family ribonuclease [Calditrichota bacterium]
MKKEIFINSSIGETRIAIVENGKLVELFVEQPEHERMVGDIYLGKVVNVVEGMHAAFVNIGMEQDAFLHFSDIGDTLVEYGEFVELNGKSRPNNRRRPRPIPKEGQEILVQVIKEPIGNKGARVTTQLSFPGRFLVLVPNSDIVGVSKKIYRLKQKKTLKRIAREIKPPGFGLIVRTVAETTQEQALRNDLEHLLEQWRRLERKVKRVSPPTLIYKDVAMASSVIRDLFTPDVHCVRIDSKKLHREITTYLKEVSPSLVERVIFYRGRRPLFDRFGLENEIEKSLSRKVWMPSGGHIIFDHTEALVAVDVNSGKYVGGKQPEENILRVNLEAAREIARQLRLRDIGGIIVIDFIDMLDPKNKRRLYNEFTRELRRSRAQANISQISEFGLIEMTRERVRPSLLFAFSEPCPTCDGIGRIQSKSTVLTKIERWIKRFKAERKEWSLRLVVHPAMAEFLTKGWSSKLRRLMWRYRLKIELQRDDTLKVDQFKFFLKKDQSEITDQFLS